MKLIYVLSCVALSFASFHPVMAADSSEQVVTKKDAVAVQQGMKDLAKAFGVEAPAPNKEVPRVVAVAPEKNIADVMDKAIDKVTDVAGVVAESLRKIAPEIWAIMIKQQYAKAFGDLVVPFILTLLVYLLVVRKMRQFFEEVGGKVKGPSAPVEPKEEGGKEVEGPSAPVEPKEEGGKEVEGSSMPEKPKYWKEGELTDLGVIYIFYVASWAGFIVSALWFANRLANVSKYLINPDYYAIQDLLRMLLNRSIQ